MAAGRAVRGAGRGGMVVRDTMSVVRRPGAGAGAPGRRSGVMVHHHHGTGCGGQLPACTAWAQCAGTTTPPPRTLHRGVGKKSFQHRMAEPILCRDSFSNNNYYWSSLVRKYMKCGIKYFSLVKIFSGHTAPVRWWVPR